MRDQRRWNKWLLPGHEKLHTPIFDVPAERGVRFEGTISEHARLLSGQDQRLRRALRLACGVTSAFARFREGKGKRRRTPETARGLSVPRVARTHVAPFREEMQQPGADPGGAISLHRRESGLETFECDDGIHPELTMTGLPRHKGFVPGTASCRKIVRKRWFEAGE